MLARITRNRVGANVGAIALIAANLLLATVAVWYIEQRVAGYRVLGQAGATLLISQVMLIGFWLSLGEEKWYWRMGFAIPITLGIAAALRWGTALAGTASEAANDHSPIVAFMFLAVLFGVCVLLLPIRRAWNLRLAWQGQSSIAPVARFQVRDVLMWMIPFGVALTLFRFLASLDVSAGPSILILALEFTGVLAVLLLAARVGLQPPQLSALFVLIAMTLSVGFILGLVDAIQSINQFRSVAVRALPWQSYFWRGLTSVNGKVFALLAASLIGWLDCLVVRILGWRLVTSGS